MKRDGGQHAPEVVRTIGTSVYAGRDLMTTWPRTRQLGRSWSAAAVSNGRSSKVAKRSVGSCKVIW